MAESMIERIATILNTTPDEFGSEYVARLILEAMRDPTDAMLDAAYDAGPTGAAFIPSWEAAIDATLNERVSG